MNGLLRVSFLLLLSLLALSSVSKTSAAAQGVIVPYYIDLSNAATLGTLISAHSSNPSVPMIVIVNLGSPGGPGASFSSSSFTSIQELQSAGITVVGYVDTGYTSIPISTAETQMSEWKSWYNVNGIFFDEMQYISGEESYYSTLNIYAKSNLGMSITIGNPGGAIQMSYLNTVDLIVIYESSGMPSASSLLTEGNPPSNFAFIAYGVSPLPSASTLSSYSPYVSYLYATDASGGNPYDVLPSYFSQEVAELNTGGTAPPPPSTGSLAVSIYPPSPTIPTGQSTPLIAEPNGGLSPYSYQWYSGGSCPNPTNPTGTSSQSYSTPATASSPATYYVVVTDQSSPQQSACASDTVTMSSSSSTSSQSGTCTLGSPTSPCTFQDNVASSTTFGGAGGGTITGPTLSNPNPLPIISEVLDQNSQNAQLLITCPATPDPSKSLEYLSSDQSSFIMGNRCLAEATPLETSVARQITVTWGDYTPASSTAAISINNFATGEVSNLAYSGGTETNGNGNYNVSNGYNSASYIFGQVPASSQDGLWTWHAEYADLASINLDSLQSPDTLTGLQILNSGPGFIGDPKICVETPAYSPPCAPASTTTTILEGPPVDTNACIAACPSYSSDPVGNCNCDSCCATLTTCSGSPPLCGCSGSSPGFDCGGSGGGGGASTTTTVATTTTSAPDTCAACVNSCLNGCGSDLSCVARCENPQPGDSCYSACSGGVSGPTVTPLPARQFQPSNNLMSTVNGVSRLKTMINVGDGGGSCVSDPVPACGGIEYTVRTLYSTIYSWTCNYLYDYSVNAKVSGLGNSQIPVPVQTGGLPPPPYLLINNFPYPYTANNLPPGSCSATDLFRGTACGGWTKIPGSTLLVLANGKKYSGVNVYLDPAYPTLYWTVYSTSWFGYLGFSLHTGDVPISTIQYNSIGALPYLLYNVSVPATLGALNGHEEFLNLSFDVYSPHNYLDPANSLEPFPLFTDSGVFASYNNHGTYELSTFSSNVLSLSNPDITGFSSFTSTFLSSLTQSQLLSQGMDITTKPILGLWKNLGSYVSGFIANPIYLSAAPNDYLYVLASTDKCTFWIFGCNQNIYLYTMRFIPTGDFNLQNNQPKDIGIPSCSDPATCANSWNSMWDGPTGYWANVLPEQSQNLYITNIYPISTSSSSFWTAGNWHSDTANPSIAPVAITTDYNDDIFMLGCNSGSDCSKFKLAEMIPGAGGGNYIYYAGSTPKGFKPTGELAADPSGQYVYLADGGSPGRINAEGDPGLVGYGNVLVYSAPPTSNFVYTGGISLSYSDMAYNFNVVAYLANGGPFGNALIASAYSNVAGFNDVASNHNPIAISEYDGFLYVLDDWTFAMPQAASGGVTESSAILMLRVFSENGVEVPIDGSSTNYLVPASGSALDTSQGATTIPEGGWAPYGWPLSANISISSLSVPISYCAAGCTYSPTTLRTNYEPIGPRMSQYGEFLKLDGSGFGFTTDFNGTSYLLVHDYKWGDSYGVQGYDTSDIQLYTEMLSFKLNLVNYTTTSFGADSPYTCYIGGNSIAFPNTPCTYDASDITSNTYAPLLGVPSSFSFVESRGSPQQYFSLSDFISSLFPGGVSGGSGTSSQQTVNPSCVSGGSSTGTPTCSSGSPTCSSSTTPSCSSGSVPSCTSGSASCAPTSATIYCSNGSDPACDDSSAPACSVSSPSKPQKCTDGKMPTCPPVTEGAGDGTIECSTQIAVSCPDKSAPACDTTTDPSNTPLCNTNLQVSCSSGSPQCASGTPQCLSSGTISSSSGSITATILNTYVNSIITGYLLVPYHYTYQLTQQWSPDPAINGQVYHSTSFNWARDPQTITDAPGSLPGGDFTGTLCPDYPLPSPVPAPVGGVATSTEAVQTVYAMNEVDLKSNYLQENIQGGASYLQLPQLAQVNQNYYSANLSDVGTIISPDINYNIYTNRWLGELFINQTVAPSPLLPETISVAQVVNAVRSNSYALESYVQQSKFGSSFAYLAQDVIPLSDPVYGANCGGAGCPANYYYDPSVTSPLSGPLTYANTIQNNFLPLFNLFEQSSYLYNLDLDMSQNQNIYGYNRFVYTFVDAFNNIITAPLDADIANIASVTATASTTPDPENANETNVVVTGTATYALPSGVQPLPAGSQIYLYYDSDINFYNTIVTSAGSPAAYYEYALQCAFSSTSTACQLANPLSTLTQPANTLNPQTFGPVEANVITFQTQYNYNSLSPDYTPTPSCAPPPKSLLDLPNYNECNIYGSYGLNAIRTNLFGNSAAPIEYCIPVYQNGNGVFTSQLGLAAIASTLPDGTFNAVFYTCGSGSHSVIAQYYGYPPPEPVPTTQPSLQYSANVFTFTLPANAFVTSNELNYAYSQAALSVPVNIGSYGLSFGEVDAVILVLAAIALLALSYRKRAK